MGNWNRNRACGVLAPTVGQHICTVLCWDSKRESKLRHLSIYAVRKHYTLYSSLWVENRNGRLFYCVLAPTLFRNLILSSMGIGIQNRNPAYGVFAPALVRTFVQSSICRNSKRETGLRRLSSYAVRAFVQSSICVLYIRNGNPANGPPNSYTLSEPVYS